MKQESKTHHLEDMWKVYANRILNKNPHWFGKTHNKIENFYLYQEVTNKKDGVKKFVLMFSYERFRRIIETYFDLAKEYIIEGYALDLTHYLGKLAMRTVERNYKNRKIDFNKTKKQPIIVGEDGIKRRAKIIYHIAEDWCRVGWHKYGMLKNETVYQFSITKNLKSGKGFNQMIIKALTEQPELKNQYLYYPLIEKK